MYVRGIPFHQAEPLLERAAVYATFFELEVAYYTIGVLRVNDPDFVRDWLLDGTGRQPDFLRTHQAESKTGGQDTRDK